jgi:GTP-binding protein Era
MRYGTIAIVGRSNVGKSTFLNSALGMPLAIVSRTPQTTRDTLLGVVNSGDAQLAFVDTPGLHHPKNELGRRMNQEATDSLRHADAALFMTDAHELGSVAPEGGKDAAKAKPRSRATSTDRSDSELIALLPKELPTVLVINKVDRMHDKTRLLPLLQGMAALHPFAAVVPISAKHGDGVDRVLAEVAKLLPEQDQRFPADEVTDRPVSFFASEYIREQVLTRASREVPHAVAVTIDQIEESTAGMHVSATIHVEKLGQRAILVGKGGEMIREIGTAARKRLMELTEQPVHLRLFVRVTERWREVPRQLAELGYAPESS